NLTYVGDTTSTPSPSTVFHFRRGAGGTVRNAVVIGAAAAFRLEDAETCSQLGTTLTFQQIMLLDVANVLASTSNCDPSQVPGGLVDVDLRCYANDVKDPFHPTLADLRPRGAGISAIFSAATPPSDGFFDVSATYLGAFAPESITGSIPWDAGW